jgi:hypothetical protein
MHPTQNFQTDAAISSIHHLQFAHIHLKSLSHFQHAQNDKPYPDSKL